MSLLSRLFGSKSPAGAVEDIDAQLARLEAEAGTARPGYVGSAFNRAGDLALKAERPDQAVGYYGRGIDAFLEDGQRELARGVANKIIRVRPTAIRTLCTLTWLDLAARHQATALLHLRDYSAAAKQASQGDRAATQIYAMARLSPDPQFVDAVADALDGLDFANRAEEVRRWATEGAPDAVADGQALSEVCVTAALGSNDPDTPMLSDENEVAEDEAAEATAEDLLETPPDDSAEDSLETPPGDSSEDSLDEPSDSAEGTSDPSPDSAPDSSDPPPDDSAEDSSDTPSDSAEDSPPEAPDTEEPDAEEPDDTASEVADDSASTKKGKKGRKSRKSRRGKKKRR